MTNRDGEAGVLEEALLESVVGRAAGAARDLAAGSWTRSATRRFVMRARAGWNALVPAERLRVGAGVGAVAMIVDRLLALTVRAAPLSWVLPVVVFVACAAAAAASERIVRLGSRRR